MAITTDTGAKKIENSENWRNIFGIHNDTVDAYDALAEQKDEEIGIVVKGNKTAHTGGAAAGQYIILRNSTITGCDDGLYTAAQAIPYDTVIDSTYLTPVFGGGLNALNASLTPTIIDNVSLPYTAIKDGIMMLTIHPSTGALSYYYLNETPSTEYQDGFKGEQSSTSGASYSITMIIRKGRTYSKHLSENVSKMEIRVIYP